MKTKLSSFLPPSIHPSFPSILPFFPLIQSKSHEVELSKVGVYVVGEE